MKSRLSNPYVTPFVLWQAIGARTVELMLASSQVIAHRTQRMALAGPTPSLRDQKEFALMAQEKIDVGARSMTAMTTHLLSVGQLLGVQLVAQALKTSAAMLSLANSRTLRQSLARQAALARTMQSRSAQTLSADVGRLVDKGMKPFHAAAVSNARRLTRR